MEVEGNLNAVKYIHILETSFLPSVGAYSIEDPLLIYMVQVQEWFKHHPEIHLLNWPPEGCDINPTENL